MKAIIRKSIFHREIILVPAAVASKGVNIFSYIYENNVLSYKTRKLDDPLTYTPPPQKNSGIQ
jgi:hypothetical protein